MEGAPTRLVAWQRPGPVLAVVLVLLTVAAATGVVYPLKQAAPVVSLGVVYLLGVLLVSTYVGLLAGLLTGLLSATAFNFFHLPPLHRFTLANSEDWVALAAFVVAAASPAAWPMWRERARGRQSSSGVRRISRRIWAGFCSARRIVMAWTPVVLSLQAAGVRSSR